MFNLTPTPKTANPRKYTVSIAIPGSIVENAQSPELRTYLVGQIARAVAVFNIDEIIIYNEDPSKGSSYTSSTPSFEEDSDDSDEETGDNTASKKPKKPTTTTDGVFESISKKGADPNLFLARVLQYLETPQYLRKALFPVHRDLRYAGLLNPIDCPHHVRIDDISLFREGVTLDRYSSKKSLVDCGMRKEVQIDRALQPGIRVTVQLDVESVQDYMNGSGGGIRGTVVSPKAPRETYGLYWGYNVRLASSISRVFSESPFEDGYDLTIGTSERGQNIDTLKASVEGDEGETGDGARKSFPRFRHLLIVFGGVKGIEAAIETDEELKISSDDAEALFDLWINTCPAQGSRTIRSEEAILITMSGFRPLITAQGRND
ncbi:hypothetical protein HK102_005536 [Quaeritorhiza haematococci]|nr:hypothetical protein HK102_005536 [Quaeritorhiza haematococci]